jgi:hypothetical protein
MKFPDNTERRKSERKEVDARATVTVEGHAPLTLNAVDLSEGGVFLKHESGPRLAEGAEVYVEVAMTGAGDAPIVAHARVVRVTAYGVGLMFID